VADLHLAPKVGTNMAVLNGLQHLLTAGGYVDRAFVEEHTVGFAELKRVVQGYPPERVEKITGIPAADLCRAAEMIGTSKGLLSTVLQSVYQSNQATASACQVSNINLILGRIGRPGCGILQMNGQPTAQNTRETGADGDLPGFRNWVTSSTSSSSRTSGTSRSTSSPIGRRRPTRCRSCTSARPARSGCSGSRPPTPPCPCLISDASVAC
jgi:anaerobic selenocysteine-containing dehydrogenase